MKKLEYGRSMVEMLGVLAIIGVLSVGAIAGYQKAMFKMKLNRLISGVYHLVNNIDLILSHNDHEISKNLIEVAVKMNLIPDGFSIDDTDSSSLRIIHPYKGSLYMNMSITNSGKTYMAVSVNDIPYEVCINYLTSAKFNLDNLSYYGVKHTNEIISDFGEHAIFYKAINHNQLGDKNRIYELCNTYCTQETGQKSNCTIVMDYALSNY